LAEYREKTKKKRAKKKAEIRLSSNKRVKIEQKKGIK